MHTIYRTVSAEAAAHLQIRRGILAALTVSLFTNAALALTLLTKTDESRTIVLAPDYAQTYVATNDSVSPNLLERFSGESLSLILNMTPATANANAETFLKHVAPASYASIASKVRRGASELIRNYASSVFYPMTSAVDAEAKSVCINGERRLMIANTVTESHEITACMRYLITSGRMQMTQLTIRRTEKADMAKELAAFVGKAASTDTQSESDDFDEDPAAPNA